MFALVFFSVPFGWENTLCGYQAEFYFVLLFGAGLHVAHGDAETVFRRLVGRSGLRPRWRSFPSDRAFVPRQPSRRSVWCCTPSGLRRTRKQLLAVALHAGLAMLGVALIPKVDYHAGLKAASVAEFLDAWASILSWPISFKYCGTDCQSARVGLYRSCAPQTCRPPAAAIGSWWQLLVWAVLQDASVAYGRANGFRPPRYLDLYAVGVLANLRVCTGWLRTTSNGRHGWKVPAVAVCVASF